ncbi:uncharacterized protein BO72DRAFT_476338 [Aspergillus fijiensis CBS 313.89]|uniref:Uncharacterized protein n=1 Tax=Aspergillus fijiensis CBS 313.89 TaxID=1448319 RepID=A0A8G1RRD8_9EURO|nr:uncharacterized protein BO72DRAFT_476338 [Aspergillus fijiensis CBS 313.89]RAK78847.1 hypothetical protein BO72DRAFT_476338 [Aspergillus fijiensis CBS 313.89]
MPSSGNEPARQKVPIVPSNKDRLYVALYARGGKARMPGKEDTYHWAVHTGPKSPTEQRLGVRYHTKERLTVEGKSEFIFEESEVSPQMVLVRIAIAKILDQDRAVEILRSTAIRQNATEWNCVSWVQEALGVLNVDSRALGTRTLDWVRVRDAAMEYCQRKKDQHRLDGKGDCDMGAVPTYDLMVGRELAVQVSECHWASMFGS